MDWVSAFSGFLSVELSDLWEDYVSKVLIYSYLEIMDLFK